MGVNGAGESKHQTDSVGEFWQNQFVFLACPPRDGREPGLCDVIKLESIFILRDLG